MRDSPTRHRLLLLRLFILVFFFSSNRIIVSADQQRQTVIGEAVISSTTQAVKNDDRKLNDKNIYGAIKPDLTNERNTRQTLPVVHRRRHQRRQLQQQQPTLLYNPNTDPPERAFDYYESLRTSNAIFNVKVPVGSSQIYAVVTNLGKSYRLAEVKAFLPFSNGERLRDNGAVLNDAFAVLLAMYHFNNAVMLSNSVSDATVVAIQEDHPELQDCNVRLTTELVDTRFSPIETTRTFSTILRTVC